MASSVSSSSRPLRRSCSSMARLLPFSTAAMPTISSVAYSCESQTPAAHTHYSHAAARYTVPQHITSYSSRHETCHATRY